MFPRWLMLLLPLQGCVALVPVEASKSNSLAQIATTVEASPLMQMHAKDYCALHCGAMTDRDRIEFFRQFIWARYVDNLHREMQASTRARRVTLILNGNATQWEDAVRDAALFTRVSPGKWSMNIVAAPRERVKALAQAASLAYEASAGPGEVVILGLLDAGASRIEIGKLR